MNPLLPLPDQPRARTKYVRKGIAVLVCIGPVLLAVASLAAGVWNADFGIWGMGPTATGLLIGGVNAYFSWVRPWRYRRRHGSMAGYRFVSAIPILGTLCVVEANVFGFGEVPTAALGLLTLFLDSGGLPWFLIAIWRDRDFWDR